LVPLALADLPSARLGPPAARAGVGEIATNPTRPAVTRPLTSRRLRIRFMASLFCENDRGDTPTAQRRGGLRCAGTNGRTRGGAPATIFQVVRRKLRRICQLLAGSGIQCFRYVTGSSTVRLPP